METADIILLVFLGIGAVNGYRSGLLMQLLGIIAFFLAIIGGFHLMGWMVGWLSQWIDGYEKLLPFLAFFFIFLFVLIVINMIGKGLKSLIDMTLLGSFDNFAGALIGIFKWALVVSLLMWVVQSFGFYPLEEYTDDTVIFPVVASMAPFLLEIFSGLLPVIQELFNETPDYPQA